VNKDFDMKNIQKIRNRWHVSDGKGSTVFFKSEEAAKEYAGHPTEEALCETCACAPCECFIEKEKPKAVTSDVNINIGNNIDFGKGNIF